MMCCALVALLAAAIAASRSVLKGVLAHLPHKQWVGARWVAAVLAVTLVLAGGSALAARDLVRPAPERADLAEILMRHICGGRSAPRPPAGSIGGTAKPFESAPDTR